MTERSSERRQKTPPTDDTSQLSAVSRALELAANALLQVREILPVVAADEELEEVEAEDRDTYDGRKLPKGYLKCGDGKKCGSVNDTYVEGKLHKSCSSKAGSCRQRGCECHLFRHEKKDKPGQPKNSWEHWCNPDEAKPSPADDYEYACICVEEKDVS